MKINNYTPNQDSAFDTRGQQFNYAEGTIQEVNENDSSHLRKTSPQEANEDF
jgi:hypothetical protein